MLIVVLFSANLFAGDIYIEKDNKGNPLLVVSVQNELVTEKISIGKLSSKANTSPLAVLNDFYYWAYRNDIKQLMSLFSKTDGSYIRLENKAQDGKSPYNNFSKLTDVNVNEQFSWGTYSIYSVTWIVGSKNYQWLDAINCNKGTCTYSDFLLRFTPLESAVSHVISGKNNSLPVDKSKLKKFTAFPKRSTSNPLEVSYTFESDVFSLSSEDEMRKDFVLNLYFRALKKAQEAPEKKVDVKRYWNISGESEFIPSYSYSNGNIRVQDYQLRAFDLRFSSYEDVNVLGRIPSAESDFYLCKGRLAEGQSELFFVPVLDNKIFVPTKPNVIWNFINTIEFAAHINTASYL
ncbi:hypothetical protein [Echinimonas agarilytica]|uniref:Uncharacterized protein n=1 Tax=Echinimonas agarilytica TaxID=1215918 RepID=A0AA42B6X2_9GAMM|nr:hypothetical protein [Echinimonas agarilytica]MCM2679180.1 hypothetical protein [Echinimonas agarilytica]